MMNNVLITGANGFVGKNLHTFLEKSRKVVSSLGQCKSKNAINRPSAFSWNDLSEIKDYPLDSIIHLAGKAHDLKQVANPDDYYEINFILSKRIYDAFLQSEAKKFIFISSVKAVADSVKTILTEDVVPDPQTHYGKSKLMAEEYIQNQPLPEGKSYYILRPCMIHGMGNKGNLNLLYQLVSKGIPYPLASFKNKRSFLSVENLCFIINEIIERNDIPSGIYHLADTEPLSTNDLVKLLSQALEKTPRFLNIPGSIIRGLARVGDKLHLPLTTERLSKLTENYVVNNQKIKLALKKDLPLSAREGILTTARAFMNA